MLTGKQTHTMPWQVLTFVFSVAFFSAVAVLYANRSRADQRRMSLGRGLMAVACTTRGRGDANCDSLIDISDFEIFRKEFTGELNIADADFDDDSTISVGDFEIWRKGCFDIGACGGNAGTPTPTTPSATSAPSPTDTPVIIASSTPTSAPTSTHAPTPTFTPTRTPTRMPTPTVGTGGTMLERDFATALTKVSAVSATLSKTAYPSVTNSSGKWSTTGSSSWTSGFFPGTLWLLYERTQDPVWKTRAIQWQSGLESQKNNTSTHDVGFMMYSSYGQGYRLTNDPAYRDILITSARSLASRYSDKVGAIKSWDGSSTEYKVIIDNMMNLELLFWAARNGGDSTWRDMAVSHALKTAANHVRPDGSTYHLVTYDPATGAVKSRTTVQGYSDSSTWSRGQAWALYGFAIAYRETGDTRFLDTARKTADYYVAHLPADSVPYWDFQAPGIPNEPRDTSSAAIAASGLLELNLRDPDPARKQSYLGAANRILTSLSSSSYISEGTAYQSILMHGTQNKNNGNYDTGIVYADYYFLEALLKLARL